MSPRGRPKIIYHPTTENGEQVMLEGIPENYGVQAGLYSRAIILPISKTGAHNGETVWSMAEANKVVSYFVAQGYKLINVIFLKDNPDPDVYIMGWFLAKQ